MLRWGKRGSGLGLAGRKAGTAVPADRAISAAQFAQLNGANPANLLPRLLKEAHDVDLAEAAQAPLTTELAQVAAQLTMVVFHFHQVLDFGIARGVFAVGARSYYGRDIHATTIPDLSTYDDLLTAAAAIGNGESDRHTAEGVDFTPMNLPAASDVATLGDLFRTLRGSVQIAETDTDSQREQAMALYPAAQALAVDLCDTVEFFCRHDPAAASRRAKCERWGVVHIPDAAPPAPPAPPTP